MRKKTPPTSIRFDIEKLTLVKEREKLTTGQQVVDYFLNKYWWDNKIPSPTWKESPPLELKKEIEKGSKSAAIIEEKPIPLMEQYEHCRKLIKETTYSGDLEKAMKSIKKDFKLAAWQLKQLEAIANEHRTEFTN